MISLGKLGCNAHNIYFQAPGWCTEIWHLNPWAWSAIPLAWILWPFFRWNAPKYSCHNIAPPPPPTSLAQSQNWPYLYSTNGNLTNTQDSKLTKKNTGSITYIVWPWRCNKKTSFGTKLDCADTVIRGGCNFDIFHRILQGPQTQGWSDFIGETACVTTKCWRKHFKIHNFLPSVSL